MLVVCVFFSHLLLIGLIITQYCMKCVVSPLDEVTHRLGVLSSFSQDKYTQKCVINTAKCEIPGFAAYTP